MAFELTRPIGLLSGSRALTLRLVSLSGLTIATASLAQSDSEALQAMRACLSVEPEASRLSCFESFFEEEPRAAAAPSDGPGTGPAGEQESVPSANRGTAFDSAKVDDSQPPSAFSPVEDNRLRRSSMIGSDREQRAVTIVDLRVLRPGEIRFRTQQGELLYKTGGSNYVRYPDVPFAAELARGAMGGLFLKLPPDGQRIRVSRRR